MKKIISLGLAVILTAQLSLMSISSASFDIADEQPVYDYSIPSNVQAEINLYGFGDVVRSKPLLDENNEVIAICLDFNNAYLIYDINGNVIEYSPRNNSIIRDLDGEIYYGGPLSYYQIDDNQFFDVVSRESINKDTLASQTKRMSKINNVSHITTLSSTSTPTYSERTLKVSGLPRSEIDYNNGSSCGQVATAIMLMYYDDYIDDNYVTDYFQTYTEALHDFLAERYFPHEDGYYGTGYASLTKGINNYFKDFNINNSAAAVKGNIDGCLNYNIGSRDEPIIIKLKKDENSTSKWSINHWVVGYGYSDIYINGKFSSRRLIVNDGWGHNEVYIVYDSLYVDGAVDFYN